MNIDIHALATSIAENMRPSVPVSVSFWGKKEIGGCFGLGMTSVDSLVKRPDFPPSYRLPTKGNGSQPRWKACDVLEWAETYRGKEVSA